MDVKRFTDDAILPTRSHPTDAGLDFYSTENYTLSYGSRVKINTHVGVRLPEGTVGLIQDRSSMGNAGIRVLGGVIDANYRGEIQIILAYVAKEVGWEKYPTTVNIERGDKIAQMVIVPILTPAIQEVIEFETTDRNDSGFGSTGR